jgi:chromosome segregation ATPase
VNYFAPGFRELARILGRLNHRSQLWFERRKLARLESALGLLGWQQADYEGPTQEHVKQLTDCERAQAGLTNESAALGIEIQELEQERGTREREMLEACSEALAREWPAAKSAEELEEQMTLKRKERKEIADRLPALDRELGAAEERYRALVGQEMPPPNVQAELLRLRGVILALPREKVEWQAKLSATETQIAAMEGLMQSLREARAAFEKRDRELAGEISVRQRAKRKVETRVETLEKAKADPYREIGRALADNGIGPLNQPEALAAVIGQREKIATRESLIALSLDETAQENREAVWQSWLLTGTIVLLGAVAVLVIAGQ